MQGQNLQDLLLSAISLVHNPASSVEQRKEAVLFIEQVLMRVPVILCQSGTAVAWAMKSKNAVLLAATVRQRGAVSYNELLPQLLAAGSGNTTQEDPSPATASSLHRSLQQQPASTSNHQMLQQHFVAATECQTGGRSAEMQAHSAALTVPSLDYLACGEMLHCAIISLAHVFTICFQADVLALLRAIIVGFMLKGSSVAHTTLQELLQIPQQQIVDFEAQLRGLNREKEQRAVIRQLVADSAGEEVRKMLASVAKINTSMNGSSAAALAVANEVQQKRKLTVDVKPEFDQNLSGSIYGMLFPDGQ
eukprot:gene25278-10930_t